MEKEQVIKTADLCYRCKYSALDWCPGKDCLKCESYIEVGGGRCKCRCLTIKHNTPCPYFDEKEATT